MADIKLTRILLVGVLAGSSAIGAGLGSPVVASPSGMATSGDQLPVVSAKPLACSSKYTTANLRRCLKGEIRILNTLYRPIAKQYGKKYVPAKLVIFKTKPPKNPCENFEDGGVGGSFYCAKTLTMYMSTYELKDATIRYVQRAKQVPGVLEADAKRAKVPVAQIKKGFINQAAATVLAHEYAHHMLDQLGIDKWFKTRSAKHELGSSLSDRYHYATETAADCLSGYAVSRSKHKKLARVNGFDLWAGRAFYAATHGFFDEMPVRSPFVYKEIYRPEIYRGYGEAYWRLKAFNYGYQAGAKSGVGIKKCVIVSAKWKKVPYPKALV